MNCEWQPSKARPGGFECVRCNRYCHKPDVMPCQQTASGEAPPRILRFNNRITVVLRSMGIGSDRYAELVENCGTPPHCSDRSEWWLKDVREYLATLP